MAVIKRRSLPAKLCGWNEPEKHEIEWFQGGEGRARRSDRTDARKRSRTRQSVCRIGLAAEA